MRQRLHTIWVTTLTLIALLLSSAVTSAPLMPLQMLANSQMTMTINDSSSTHCMPSQEDIVNKIQECCDSESMVMDHQCCASTCVASYTALPGSSHTYTQSSSLVLIPEIIVRQANSVTSSLFRPPIA
jgi:hypothetical protein